jgi:cardiolipin synthase A/B
VKQKQFHTPYSTEHTIAILRTETNRTLRCNTESVRLLVQPGDGVQPLVDAIDHAKSHVDIAIFRFDRNEIEAALVRAIERGVSVHASIAYKNRGGEGKLRALEMRLLEKGVTVARTANDLVRYHGKYMIIDRKELFLLAFNYTYLDMEHSRSFGVITKDQELVDEALKLFDADCKRQPYEPGLSRFVVSPLNARKELTDFIAKTEKQLLIYDPKLGDPRILRQLEELSASGVDVRAIAEVTRTLKLENRELGPMRLHTRSMIRDGEHVFVGSQSLRASELETRREVGIIFKDAKIASRIMEAFEDDWKQSVPGEEPCERKPPAVKAARKVAKAVVKNLPAVAPVIELVVKNVIGADAAVQVDTRALEETVIAAVKSAVEESVRGAVQEVVDQNGVVS